MRPLSFLALVATFLTSSLLLPSLVSGASIDRSLLPSDASPLHLERRRPLPLTHGKKRGLRVGHAMGPGLKDSAALGRQAHKSTTDTKKAKVVVNPLPASGFRQRRDGGSVSRADRFQHVRRKPFPPSLADPVRRSNPFIDVSSAASKSASLVLHRRSRSESERSSVHPLVYYQQHINQAHRRFARLTGAVGEADGPEVRERMIQGLKKRAAAVGMDVEVDGGGKEVRLRKRGHAREVEDEEPKVKTIDREAAISGMEMGGALSSLLGSDDLPSLSLPVSGSQSLGSASSSSASSSSSSSSGFSEASLAALESNSVTPPSADAVTAKNSLGISIEANDVGYFATVQIGSRNQAYKLLLDSGSADMWVPSQQCQNSDTGGADCLHTVLGTKSSSSFVPQADSPFQVTYGTGNVEGILATDDVNIAGLKLSNHTFGVTTSESNDFASKDVPFDGLMGLAKSALSNQGVLTPIEALAKAGLISKAQMGFHLGRVADGDNNGQATFGGVDQTKFQGQLTLINNVNKQGFWEGSMDDVTIDGKSANIKGRTAILDTGTTLIVAPEADANAIHAAIPGAQSDGQGGFTLPCTSTSKVALSFAGQSFTIDPRDLAFQPQTQDTKGTCVSGISAGSIGGKNQWLVGDVFLKNVYFATSVDDNQIGLAAIKPR